MSNAANYAYWMEERRHTKSLDGSVTRENLADWQANDRNTDREDLHGFWRIVGAATKPDHPAAIFEENGTTVLKVGRQMPSPLFAEKGGGYDFLGSSWTQTVAVSEADYKAAIETGAWPDGKQSRNPDAEPEAGVGHNNPPKDDEPKDPFARLAAEYERLKEKARDILKKPIKTKAQADKAAEVAKSLSEIVSSANRQHEVEKAPHWDECKRIDKKWRPLRNDPKDEATKVKRHSDDFLRAEAKKEKERQEKARREAEEAAREAERIADQAQQSQTPDEVEQANLAFEKAEEARRATRPQSTGAGKTGSKISLRTFYEPDIVDRDAFLMAVKDYPEIEEALQRIAKRIASNKEAALPDGLKRIEVQRAV